MAVDPTTISRFFRRDQCRHKDDRHGVQRPIRFKLRCYFEAVSPCGMIRSTTTRSGLKLRAASKARRGSFTAHAI
jgi:hypothetical protein